MLVRESMTVRDRHLVARFASPEEEKNRVRFCEENRSIETVIFQNCVLLTARNGELPKNLQEDDYMSLCTDAYT